MSVNADTPGEEHALGNREHCRIPFSCQGLTPCGASVERRPGFLGPKPSRSIMLFVQTVARAKCAGLLRALYSLHGFSSAQSLLQNRTRAVRYAFRCAQHLG